MTGWPAARWSSESPTVPVVSTASPPVGATKWSMVASSCSGLRPDQVPPGLVAVDEVLLHPPLFPRELGDVLAAEPPAGHGVDGHRRGVGAAVRVARPLVLEVGVGDGRAADDRGGLRRHRHRGGVHPQLRVEARGHRERPGVLLGEEAVGRRGEGELRGVGASRVQGVEGARQGEPGVDHRAVPDVPLRGPLAPAVGPPGVVGPEVAVPLGDAGVLGGGGVPGVPGVAVVAVVAGLRSDRTRSRRRTRTRRRPHRVDHVVPVQHVTVVAHDTPWHPPPDGTAFQGRLVPTRCGVTDFLPGIRSVDTARSRARRRSYSGRKVTL